MVSQAVKPLFIPLMGVYYDAFVAGTKTHEYRPLGPRWNLNTCTIGREAVLSRGYGKRSRLTKKIIGTEVMNTPPPDFVKIYGEGRLCLAIELA
jgi:hypothetical protein